MRWLARRLGIHLHHYCAVGMVDDEGGFYTTLYRCDGCLKSKLEYEWLF